MGIKNQKGTVSIENYRERIRLRWRYQGIRYALNLLAHTKANLIQARKKASEIEHDMALDCFDSSLAKYKGFSSTVIPKMSFTEQYEVWVRDYMNMDCEVNTNYNAFRNMIRKWGEVNEQNVVVKFNSEQFCVGTYNRRLTMLKTYVKWLVKKGIWKNNLIEDVQPRRGKKLPKPKRKPFTDEEIRKILEAFKNDSYCSKSSRYSHSHYYPFIYFIFKTGVRNAEAIGLRVGKIDLDKRVILINEVLARSLKGSSSTQRKRKETKNGKERVLPLTDDLFELLNPLLQNKKPDDLIFQSINGLPIDDNNLQKRVFKPILKELGIEERVLYACRHTFASRCINYGITPVNTAFLMGNNPETTLRNYTHQISHNIDLPII